MPGPENTNRATQKDYSPSFADLVVTHDYVSNQRENGWPDLHPQFKAFAETYLINGYDHRKAAEEVGFPPARGIALLRNTLIRVFISDIQSSILETGIVTKDLIDARLDVLYEMAIGEIEIPIVTGMGDEFYAKKFHGQLALSIIQERSKMHGITKPEIDGGSILDAFAQAVQRNGAK